MNSEIKKYWSKASASAHRRNDEDFYLRNAEEHIEIIRQANDGAELIDLGCGAGKLLRHYLKRLNCSAGLDISPSMLAEAKRLIHGDGIRDFNLIHADPLKYMATCNIPVWTTCGALNQYLDKEDIEDFVAIFRDNKHAKCLYLFETICPIRLPLMSIGISFREEHWSLMPGMKRKIKVLISRAIYAQNFIRGKYSGETVYLGSPIMGYGHSPKLWLTLGKKLGLNVSIIGSRYYEYRYHVTFSKDAHLKRHTYG
jgi:cyclopropane-fatty-acyl-phospholipid synthase